MSDAYEDKRKQFPSVHQTVSTIYLFSSQIHSRFVTANSRSSTSSNLKRKTCWSRESLYGEHYLNVFTWMWASFSNTVL